MSREFLLPLYLDAILLSLEDLLQELEYIYVYLLIVLEVL